MKSFKRLIAEGNPLARIDKFEHEGRHFVGISPERDNVSAEENKRRHEEIKAFLKDHGYGYRKAYGQWEGGGEDSYVVFAKAPGEEAGNQLKDAMAELGRYFGQDAIYYHNGKTGHQFGTNETGKPGLGNIEVAGKVHYNRAEQPYQTAFRPSRPKSQRPTFTSIKPKGNDDESTSGTETGRLQDGGRISGSPSKLETPGPADLAVPLKGLPTHIDFKGKTLEIGPFEAARKLAYEYMKSADLPYHPPTDYVKVDERVGKKIAALYDAMPNQPDNPMVKAAYAQMIKELKAQFAFVQKSGLDIDWIDYNKTGDPYAASLRLVAEDVRKNNHMWVLPTSAGFGSDESFDTSKHPLLDDTGIVIKGHKVLVNDMFRIVHDYFGHIKEGNGFDADGEENAWRSHSAMFSPLARLALTSETRGQSSWFNFGPYGTYNQTAAGPSQHFADEKLGLLPLWTMREGSGQPDSIDSTIMTTARKLGLIYIGFGRFERPGQKKIAFIKKNDRLIPFRSMAREGSWPKN